MKQLVNQKLSPEELEELSSKYTQEIQQQLFDQLYEFMEENHMNQTDLGRYLGFSKGYMSQLFNGNFDHKLSSMVRIMISIGKVPGLSFTPLDISTVGG